jgi:hypothetical protein
MNEYADLNIERIITARLIAAENDYNAISLEYWAAFKREYNYPVYEPSLRIPHHIIRQHTNSYYKREFARRDMRLVNSGFIPSSLYR